MNVEELREYCLTKKGVTEEFPFDSETLVYKVMGKMFALVPLERVPSQCNLKCDPERAVEPDVIKVGGSAFGHFSNKSILCMRLYLWRAQIPSIDTSFPIVERYGNIKGFG